MDRWKICRIGKSSFSTLIIKRRAGLIKVSEEPRRNFPTSPQKTLSLSKILTNGKMEAKHENEIFTLGETLKWQNCD